jgi:hypothetical protein
MTESIAPTLHIPDELVYVTYPSGRRVLREALAKATPESWRNGGCVLRAIRHHAGLSLLQAATIAECSPSHLGRIERGERRFKKWERAAVYILDMGELHVKRVTSTV